MKPTSITPAQAKALEDKMIREMPKPPKKEELRIGDLQPYLDLMADGRERTVSDVALRLKQLERVATYNLNQLVNAGFLVQTKVGGIVVWKMKP
jgi:hypothetical protein